MNDASRRRGDGVRLLAPKRSPIRRLVTRLLLVTGLLVVGLVGTHAWFCRQAAARLDREMARYRAMGERIDPSDFVEPAIADEENAAVDLMAAGELADGRSDQWRRFNELEPALPLDERELYVVESTLHDGRDALARVESATAKTRVNWKRSYESPVGEAKSPWSDCAWDLPDLLRAAALRSHQLGDDWDALVRIRQLLFMARAVEADPTLAAYGAAARIRTLACDAITQMAPRLLAGSSGDGIDLASLRAVIDELADDAGARRAMVRALQGERMAALDSIRSFAARRTPLFRRRWGGEGWIERNWIWYCMRPLALNDAPLVLGHISRLIDAVQRVSDLRGLTSVMPDVSGPDEVRGSPVWHGVARGMLWFERPVERHFRSLAERHLAAAALAIRVYAIDHGGRLPADLDDLVPRYLAAIPTDPMAAGGRRLGYLPDPADPILYSVGNDGVDDGGDPEPSRECVRYGGNLAPEWAGRDAVVHLLPHPRSREDRSED